MPAAAVATPWVTSCAAPSLLTIAEVLFGFNHAERERVIALREQDRFFWLDISLSETSRDDLVEALGIPDGAVRALWGGDANVPQAFYADGESVVFALQCYAVSDTAPPEAHRLRPLRVQVLVTGEYLLTLHEEHVSPPAALGLELPEERAGATSSTRCSTGCSRPRSARWRRSR